MSARAKGRAVWLPDVLRDAGLPVEVLPEFATAGKAPKEWVAIVDHHDASPISSGNNGGLTSIRYGRPDLAGPLANLFLKRDGTHVCVSSGAANHPGVSYLPLRGGISSGVKYWALGREVALDGVGEPFPTSGRQYEAMQQANAAISIYLGLQPATQLWDHKSIARPIGRKIDIRPYDLPDGRVRVARFMTNTTKDWFDMASEADLIRIIDARLAAALGPTSQLDTAVKVRELHDDYAVSVAPGDRHPRTGKVKADGTKRYQIGKTFNRVLGRD